MENPSGKDSQEGNIQWWAQVTCVHYFWITRKFLFNLLVISGGVLKLSFFWGGGGGGWGGPLVMVMMIWLTVPILRQCNIQYFHHEYLLIWSIVHILETMSLSILSMLFRSPAQHSPPPSSWSPLFLYSPSIYIISSLSSISFSSFFALTTYFFFSPVPSSSPSPYFFFSISSNLLFSSIKLCPSKILHK